MKILTEDATLVCNHVTGTVDVPPTEDLVFVEGRRVLVEDNPENRPIAGCPLLAPARPCLHTLAVEKGYSDLVRIEGRPLCLDTVTGLTDGTPPGEVHYRVLQPGQDWVSEGE